MVAPKNSRMIHTGVTRDYILFYEYFHGDNGAGLGASHQTGWTGLVAKTLELFGRIDAEQALKKGKLAAFVSNKT